MLEKSIYYVYIYLNPEKQGSFKYSELNFDFEPIYVGKGRRFLAHFNYPNGIRKNPAFKCLMEKFKIKNIKPIMFFLKENLSEKDSFETEKYIIKLIGRKCSKDGPLRNLTEGGEGHTKKPSKKWLLWLSDYQKKTGKWVGDKNPSKNRDCSGIHNGFWGKKPSLDAIKRRAETLRKRGKPSPLKGRILGPCPSKGVKGRPGYGKKTWFLIDYFGHKRIIKGLYTFCKNKPFITRYFEM